MICFADVAVDLDGHEIRRDGAQVRVEPQVFDVLAYLIVHRDRLVPKSELLDQVWGHRFVTESALSSRIKSARQAIGDTGRDQRMIRTVHGKGYRFVADVQPGGSGGAAGQRAPRTVPASADAVPPVEALLDDLVDGRGAAVRVGHGPAAAAYLRALRAGAARRGLAVGLGSTHRSSLRTYGCLIDAVDELTSDHPELLADLPGPVRSEIAHVVGGSVPSRRQRWVLAVHELLVSAADHHGGVVLVLEAIEHADDDTVAAIAHLGDLAVHHRVVIVVSERGLGHPLPGFRRVELADDGEVHDDRHHLPADLADAVGLATLLEMPVDIDTLAAALGVPVDGCARLLDHCDRLGALHTTGDRYTIDATRLDLGPPTAPHHRVGEHRHLAQRLADAGCDPARVGHHFLEGGDARRALPHVVTAARARMAAGLFREALRWIDRVLSEASGSELADLHGMRADALGALGNPAAVSAYRQAIGFADPGQVPRLRARLARAVLWSGDIDGAEELLGSLEPTGGPADEDLLLVRGMVAYFRGDLSAADAAADAARELALQPGASASLLDAITLQGMIDHSRGRWSDRLSRELRDTRMGAEVATTVFDCHLCVAEYLLYGPTPYQEVVDLADRLRSEAETAGAPRGVAFGLCLAGEAELLRGNLDAGDRLLEQSVTLHRELGGDTGLAHSLQRLAEVRLAEGERAAAVRLCRDALARARWSPLSHHLLQRIYGTLVRAAASTADAVAMVHEAAEVLDEADCCQFCEVMFAVPAAIACAQAGRLADAERYVRAAEASAFLWQGTAWRGAVAEARAAVAAASGDPTGSDALLRQAAADFEAAGQPIDAARCLDAVGGEA